MQRLILVAGTEVPNPTPSSPQRARQAAPLVEAFRALRAQFVKRGAPLTVPSTNEESAWHVAFWGLYEIGHVLDEIEARAADGLQTRAFIRAGERGAGRVCLELFIEPVIVETLESAPRALGGVP
jgi:hypothetical protein